MKKLITYLVFFASVSFAFGQKTEVGKQKNQFEVHLYVSYSDLSYQPFTIDDVAERFPSKVFEGNKYFDIQQRDRKPIRGNLNQSKISLGFGKKVNLLSTPKIENTWRMQALYLNSNSTTRVGKLRKIEDLTGQTIFDSYNPKSIFLFEEQYFVANVANKYLQLQSDILFRFHPAERVSIFTGIGVGIGFSYKGKLRISTDKVQDYVLTFEHTSSDTLNSPLNSQIFLRQNNQFNPETDVETISLGWRASGFLYAPIGLDFAIGKKRGASKHHIFYESQIGFRLTDIFIGEKSRKFEVRQGLGYRFIL